MAMTKKEFAARLLFWLLPWPISKILPRSLRIYYFGPSGEPPSGWYDFYGVPVYIDPDVPPFEDVIDEPPHEEPPWWPPDAPPYDEFIEDPPVEPPPWWPIDPYDPPPPDQFPDVPDGPVNLIDPYKPGPGGSDPSHPSAPTPPLTEVTIECEDIALRNSRIRAQGTDGDTWSQARQTPFSLTHFPDEPFHEEMVGFDYDAVNDRWYINRTFALFDLTALPAGKTVYAAMLLLHGKRYNDLRVSVQKSTQADPFTAPEWDDFEGDTFRYNDFVIDADSTFGLNAAGIAYIQSVFGSFAKLAIRDYDYDYLNVAPPQSTKFSGAYSVEAAGARVPRLVIYYW